MWILYILAKSRPCTVIHIPRSPRGGYLHTLLFIASYSTLKSSRHMLTVKDGKILRTVMFPLSKLRQMRYLLGFYSKILLFLCVVFEQKDYCWQSELVLVLRLVVHDGMECSSWVLSWLLVLPDHAAGVDQWTAGHNDVSVPLCLCFVIPESPIKLTAPS